MDKKVVDKIDILLKSGGKKGGVFGQLNKLKKDYLSYN